MQAMTHNALHSDATGQLGGMFEALPANFPKKLTHQIEFSKRSIIEQPPPCIYLASLFVGNPPCIIEGSSVFTLTIRLQQLFSSRISSL